MRDDDVEYDVDFREHPEEYEVGQGSEGAFKIQPYKRELLPLWSVGDLEAAEEAAPALYERFESYLDDGDFPGADMARKYLRLGYTRAMRYAKYPEGEKYVDDEERTPERWYDQEKRKIALVYREYWNRAREHERYRDLKERHRGRDG